MEASVSILIPAFNTQRWIADTIKSAVDQTWKRKEIIVVDDGSSDNTLAIAQGFTSNIVKIVTQPNQGAAAARNKAYSLCQGDYIQWLDGDDLLAPDKIGRQMGAFDQGNGDRTLLSSAWGRFIHRINRARFIPTPLWRDLSPLEWLLGNMEENLFMPNCSWLVSRYLTDAAGPWDTRLSFNDDGEYFCRVLCASDGIHFVPEAKTYYRRLGADSLSYVGSSNKKLDSMFLSMQLQIDNILRLADTERVRMACVKYLQNDLTFFYPNRPDIVEQAQQLATFLGRQLEIPRLPWKYAGIQKVFGWNAAKRAQQFYNQFKSSAIRSWDGTLHCLKI